jgi:hypothetical protein
MLASVRRALPGVDVQQFTGAGPLALAVLEAYASVDGDWLFLDTDVLVQNGDAVRRVFDQDFDVAVATREGTLKTSEVGTKFMRANPFNKGAVFSRSQAFWHAAAARCRELSPTRQAWMGDQIAMNHVIGSGAFRVHVLPAAFNYPPQSKDENLQDVVIAHFKGKRKSWMVAA